MNEFPVSTLEEKIDRILELVSRDQSTKLIRRKQFRHLWELCECLKQSKITPTQHKILETVQKRCLIFPDRNIKVPLIEYNTVMTLAQKLDDDEMVISDSDMNDVAHMARALFSMREEFTQEEQTRIYYFYSKCALNRFRSDGDLVISKISFEIFSSLVEKYLA